MKSCQGMMMNLPLKEHGWAHVINFACATVDIEKFRHGTPLTKINKSWTMLSSTVLNQYSLVSG